MAIYIVSQLCRSDVHNKLASVGINDVVYTCVSDITYLGISHLIRRISTLF